MSGPTVVAVELLAVEALDHAAALLGALLAAVEEAVGERAAEVQVEEAQDGDVVRVGLDAGGWHYVKRAALGTLDPSSAGVHQARQTRLLAERVLARQQLRPLELVQAHRTCEPLLDQLHRRLSGNTHFKGESVSAYVRSLAMLISTETFTGLPPTI